MARSTKKSLAGSAAAAAKKVLPRRGRSAAGAATSAPTTGAAKKTTPAKKTASAKKAAPARKTAPAKKAAPAKKTAAKKTAAKTTAAAKKTTTSTPAKKTAGRTTTKKAAVKKSTEKKTAARSTAVKKTATRKAAPAKPSTLVVKEGEDAWTKAELDEVMAELNEHAARLRRELHDQEEELAGLMRDAGDGAGQDQADLGATSFERDHELTVVNNAREMLAQTERALARIADGSYGICESCGNPIGKMRVMAFPRATLCMSCKQREERR